MGPTPPLHCSVSHSTFITTTHNTTQHYTTQHYTTLHNTTLHNTTVHQQHQQHNTPRNITRSVHQCTQHFWILGIKTRTKGRRFSTTTHHFVVILNGNCITGNYFLVSVSS